MGYNVAGAGFIRIAISEDDEIGEGEAARPKSLVRKNRGGQKQQGESWELHLSRSMKRSTSC